MRVTVEWDTERMKNLLTSWMAGNKALELNVGMNSSSDPTYKVSCLLFGRRIQRRAVTLESKFYDVLNTVQLLLFCSYLLDM